MHPTPIPGDLRADTDTRAWPAWNICINYHESKPPRNMSWKPHGPSKFGFIQTCHNGQSRTVPGVVTHRGRLWCMWSNFGGDVWFTCTSEEDETEFLPRKSLRLRGSPAMAVLEGHLHAIVGLDNGHMVHLVFDDDRQDWLGRGIITHPESLLSPAPGTPHVSNIALATFQDKLFVTYSHASFLYYRIWDAPVTGPAATPHPNGTWRPPKRVPSPSVYGSSTLAVINGVLHLVCSTKSHTTPDLLWYAYDDFNSTWSQVPDVIEDRAIRGVSATSYGDITYLGFIQDKYSGIYLSAYPKHTSTKPESPEPIANQTAADPPQLAILNGRIHCIFTDNTPSRDLRWYSRPILTYSLTSWMSEIPGSTLLSQLTIPGTHDSCARSNIPYVRTQYLSITQQLSLGIRFLDLRLRRHDDNQLYLYHGGVPIGLPGRLSFQSVMEEVWSFLQSYPSETILISIDNDDNSPSQKTSPEIFYGAVELAILSTPHYEDDGSPRWFTDFSAIPTPSLDIVRGRAVLLRRYLADPTIPVPKRQGLDLSAWINDSPEFTVITPSGVNVHIQDKWRFSERISLKDLIAAKSGFVQNMMSRATGRPSPSLPPPDANPNPKPDKGKDQKGTGNSSTDGEEKDWYINFCSAVGDPTTNGEVAQAKWVAVGARSGWVSGKWIQGMNIVTREFVQARREEEELLRDEDDDDTDDDDDDINDNKNDNDNGIGKRKETTRTGIIDDWKMGNGGGIKTIITRTRRNDDIMKRMEGRETNKSKRRRWYRLGVVNMDYPELPAENDIVARLIEVNFLNF